MTRHSPQQQLKEAKQIAQDHGCFVVEKGKEYQLYRRLATRNAYIGKRSTPAALRSFVCKVTNFH
jgi:hypothetical protein